MHTYLCKICGYHTHSPDSRDLGAAQGNSERFKNTFFQLWKCPQCQTIYTLGTVDFYDIYKDYPLNKRRLDVFAQATLKNLLKRLRKVGLRKTDRILDYGCGNGIFIQFLNKQGYANVMGFDPFLPEFASLPDNVQFDCIIVNDVIEHTPDPKNLIEDCKNRLKSGGILYIGTADSGGVKMDNLKAYIMCLHLPFHRVIMNKESLEKICTGLGLKLIKSYTRSYMDTLTPFANYRFLDKFNKALGHNLDRVLEPSSFKILFKKPGLFFYAFFGYFFPSAYEPAVILKRENNIFKEIRL